MSLYNADFDELVLAHLIRSPEVLKKAKQYKIEGDDFLTSFVAGIQAYKQIAEAVLAIPLPAPIPKNILELELSEKFNNGEIIGLDSDKLEELVAWIYNLELTPTYILEHLLPFIKHRRLTKVQQNTPNTVNLYEEMHKIAVELNFSSSNDEVIGISPFDRPIFVENVSNRETGFDGLDSKLGGFNVEECSLLLASSGSGKTAVATNIALAVSKNQNVMFLSLEEPTTHLVQRFYARQFDCDYSKLRYGNADEQLELRSKFADFTAPERAAARRLKIVDARAQAPITIQGIQDILERYAAEGFITDTLIIDQMDYMSPLKNLGKAPDKWKEYEQIAFECDALSLYKIQGTHPIAVIVIHQLKGRPKWEYTYDDITGFKGIVKPFDNAIAIGRFAMDSPHINLTSLKVRHTAPFRLTYSADFSRMKFYPEEWAPPENSLGDDGGKKINYTKAKKQKKKDEENEKYGDSRVVIDK